MCNTCTPEERFFATERGEEDARTSPGARVAYGLTEMDGTWMTGPKGDQ